MYLHSSLKSKQANKQNAGRNISLAAISQGKLYTLILSLWGGKEEGGRGGGEAQQMVWITGNVDVSYIPLFKELICKVWELMCGCTLVSVEAGVKGHFFLLKSRIGTNEKYKASSCYDWLQLDNTPRCINASLPYVFPSVWAMFVPEQVCTFPLHTPINSPGSAALPVQSQIKPFCFFWVC